MQKWHRYLKLSVDVLIYIGALVYDGLFCIVSLKILTNFVYYLYMNIHTKWGIINIKHPSLDLY